MYPPLNYLRQGQWPVARKACGLYARRWPQSISQATLTSSVRGSRRPSPRPRQEHRREPKTACLRRFTSPVASTRRAISPISPHWRAFAPSVETGYRDVGGADLELLHLVARYVLSRTATSLSPAYRYFSSLVPLPRFHFTYFYLICRVSTECLPSNFLLAVRSPTRAQSTPTRPHHATTSSLF